MRTKTFLPKANPLQLPASQSTTLPSSFYNMPDSTASNLVMDVLGAGVDIADLPARKKQVNHNSKYAVMQDGKKRLVMVKNPTETAEITIELADIDKLSGSNKPAKKLFVLSLIKANEQAIHDGVLTQDFVSFPLQELIDIGFYKTPQSARKGFNTGADILTSLKVKGTSRKSKKSKVSVDSLEVPFTGAKIINGQCYLYFNDRIKWGLFAQYFTILPRYYFRLSNRASDLLYYIFYLARQNTRAIEERGYFTIGFRAIQHHLQLPSEVGNTRPKQTIKDPLEEAIEEIEDTHMSTYGATMEFTLEPVYDENATIGNYLSNGYLKVSLKGDFAQMFIQISKDTKKQLAAAEKRKQSIVEKAMAIKTAKAMDTPPKK